MNYYDEKYREIEIRRIQKKAMELGLVSTLTQDVGHERCGYGDEKCAPHFLLSPDIPHS